MKISDDNAVKIGKKMMWVAFLGFLLFVLYMCGDRAIRRQAAAFEAARAPKGHMENGYWVKHESTAIKPRIETRSLRKEAMNGKDVEITTNCREMYEYIATLEPGENIQIRHIDFGSDSPTKNRCSYSNTGASVPIYGDRKTLTNPRFRYDLPFPDAPHTVVVFLLRDANKKTVAYDYIKEAGGIMYLANPLQEKVTAHLQYNYMQAFMTDPVLRQEIGHDGSTAKFHATRFVTESQQ